MRSTLWVVAVGILVVVAAAVEAGDLNPPIVGMAEHVDPTKTVSIQLPVNWTDVGADTRVYGGVQRWSGFIQPPKPDGPDAQMQVTVQSTYSRAELARWAQERTEPGKLVANSVTRGDGWIDEIRHDDAKHVDFVVRWVESQGQVWELSAYGHESILPHIYGHLHAIFDTFKALQPWPGSAPPAGFAKTDEGGCAVWTDTKDKKTVKRTLDAHAAVWTELAKILPGAPAIADPPVVILFDKDPAYAQYTAQAANQTSPTSVIDFRRRALVVRIGGKVNSLFDRGNQLFSAIQFSQLYFGGKSPDWIERGLGVWSIAAVAAKGKPEKPPAEFVKGAKEAVAARKERLDAALDVRREDFPEAESDHIDMSFYAWHCFFQFGPGGKTYGDRYQKYFTALRETGSPDEAKKVWDGVDFAAMRTEFETWVAGWKP
jgi:hypothetical protein